MTKKATKKVTKRDALTERQWEEYRRYRNCRDGFGLAVLKVESGTSFTRWLDIWRRLAPKVHLSYWAGGGTIRVFPETTGPMVRLAISHTGSLVGRWSRVAPWKEEAVQDLQERTTWLLERFPEVRRFFYQYAAHEVRSTNWDLMVPIFKPYILT